MGAPERGSRVAGLLIRGPSLSTVKLPPLVKGAWVVSGRLSTESWPMSGAGAAVLLGGLGGCRRRGPGGCAQAGRGARAAGGRGTAEARSLGTRTAGRTGKSPPRGRGSDAARGKGTARARGAGALAGTVCTACSFSSCPSQASKRARSGSGMDSNSTAIPWPCTTRRTTTWAQISRRGASRRTWRTSAPAKRSWCGGGRRSRSSFAATAAWPRWPCSSGYWSSAVVGPWRGKIGLPRRSKTPSSPRR
jgi:hypothetical protein